MKFNEDSRVKIPALLHLMRLGYQYIPLNHQNRIESNNMQLASLRDWLLPMLMNGQVTVGDYEVEDSELGMVAEDKVEYKRVSDGWVFKSITFKI